MKILHINTHSTSGACIAATRFHVQMLKMGIDSKMLFLHKRGYDVAQTFEYRKSEEIPDTYLNRQKLRLQKLFNPNKKTTRQLNEQKLVNRPLGFEMFSFATTEVDIFSQKLYQEADIIHFHWTGTFIDYSFFAKNNKPVVWTMHDMNPFTGGCHYSNGCEKYFDNCSNCPQLQNTQDTENAKYDLEYKIRMLLHSQPYLVSPSQWLLDCALKSAAFKNGNGETIRNCVDFNIFQPYDRQCCRTVFNLPKDKKILLFVSDTIENTRKGFDLLLDAIKMCNSNNVHLCAIGKKSDKIDYPENISFIGKIKDEKLLALAYSAADAFVLPSIEDNLPNVMLESLACGIPVISFPVGGMNEIIETGINGIISKEISARSLADTIQSFVHDELTFSPESIRQSAMRNFDPEAQTFRYLKLYHKLLKK